GSRRDKPSQRGAKSKLAPGKMDDRRNASPHRQLWIAAVPAVGAAVIRVLGLVFVINLGPLFGAGLRANSTAACLAFVGSEACAECHQAETALWKGSQHRHAMQHAGASTVLGNFDDGGFDYFGVHSRFFKRDNKFFVETDGPDGKLATFEV